MSSRATVAVAHVTASAASWAGSWPPSSPTTSSAALVSASEPT